MRYIAAYLLLQTGGNASPSASDIKKLLSTVGIESDDERLDKLLSEISGKDINEVRRLIYPITRSNILQLISEGSSKLSSVPSGGAGGGGGAPGAAGGAAAGGAAAAEEKKEEKVEEKVRDIINSLPPSTDNVSRKNLTTTWASVCLTKYTSHCSIISKNIDLLSHSLRGL